MSARGSSRKYWLLHLIWVTKAMLSVGRRQLHLGVTRPNGCKKEPLSLPSIVRYALILSLEVVLVSQLLVYL